MNPSPGLLRGRYSGGKSENDLESETSKELAADPTFSIEHAQSEDTQDNEVEFVSEKRTVKKYTATRSKVKEMSQPGYEHKVETVTTVTSTTKGRKEGQQPLSAQLDEPVYETPMTRPVEHSASSTLFRRVENDRARRLSDNIKSTKKPELVSSVNKRLLYDDKPAKADLELSAAKNNSENCHGMCVLMRLKAVSNAVRESTASTVHSEYLLNEFLNSHSCVSQNCQIISMLGTVITMKNNPNNKKPVKRDPDETDSETLEPQPKKKLKRGRRAL